MNFLADENVDRQIVDRLRQDGHILRYVIEMEAGISDDTVLDLANKESCLLITADKDEKMIKISIEWIEQAIFLIRGQKVLLDADLAQLYGVETKILNKAVKRNLDRFPEDFMFQLTAEEAENLRFQTGTSKKQRGGRRYLPYAFTEQGVAMLSGVLNSPRAVKVNVEIMRAFVRLRQLMATHTDLARKLTALEQKYDKQFKVVFDAIRALMTPPAKPHKKIGFVVKERQAAYGRRGIKRKKG